MPQLIPGSQALIIGARTPGGRINIGKSVNLFGLFRPGQRFINPVNGMLTALSGTSSSALWLVTGENIVAFDGKPGFAFVRAAHLLPIQSSFPSPCRYLERANHHDIR
ncbi:hypothetical protein [Erwinia sp. HR93]|uniref:hypothetical protein n=1 Tax=Erwinia sp. HR93 TaxID=3094840 RepID=UPI002ADED37E|nr:hypothetical protein [Erwinia sp. HR93]MEA1064862.1 hypothetical protein [Erwinia sp. HR93]